MESLINQKYLGLIGTVTVQVDLDRDIMDAFHLGGFAYLLEISVTTSAKQLLAE